MLNYASKEELQDICSDYDSIIDFASRYKSIDFYKFDNFVVKKISLFLVHENLDLKAIETTVDMIYRSLRFLLLIFEKPIIHLKEINEIVPIEMVHKINNDTLFYATIHTELWDNITSKGIKPRKLLTLLCDNNYCIYENQIFAQTIDDILYFLRKNIRAIVNLIFANQNLVFNLLDRLDHTNYYLACGKLHSGYVRNFNKFYAAEALNDKMLKLATTIQGYCKYKVYVLNKHRKKRLQLKLTNILKMQKNYHQMYLLAKKLNTFHPKNIKFSKNALVRFENGYFNFCQILTIFALTHLNFSMGDAKKLNLRKLNSLFTFKNWKLQVKAVECKHQRAILLSFKKDTTYRILLVPDSVTTFEPFTYDKKLRCNEVISLSPFISNRSALYVAITDFESFLRLQQLILRGMIYVDRKHKNCPFCGGSLTSNKTHTEWVCPTCRTKIKKHLCPKHKKTYYSTAIDGLLIEPSQFYRLPSDMELSRAIHHRNITRINQYGEPYCPHCSDTHY
ncbi:MAG: hypothetical protein MJ208_01575 [Bacilli bacterium]|nr:hypothetical protein [Bacilli bacterium]